MDEQTIANMRARVQMCRKLASSTTDKPTADVLRQIADEGEADIRQLQAERREPE